MLTVPAHAVNKKKQVVSRDPQASSASNSIQDKGSPVNRGTENLPLVVHPDNRTRTRSETDWFEGKERTEASQKQAELILTAVVAATGLLQIVVLGLQWWLIRIQTHHTVNSERAWFWCKADIAWSQQKDGKYIAGVGFTFQNSGKTPGFINELGFAMDVLPNETTLPEIPKDYANEDFAKWGGRGLLVVPNNTVSRLGQMEAEPRVFAQIMSGEQDVWIHGFVRYRDTFVGDQRESRYCFKWNPQRGGGESSFSIQGPEVYNRAT
jgi:hypothetical protein